MSSHISRYAGISIQKNGSGRPITNFHTTGARKMGLWMDLPGRATFKFIKLPKQMNKLNAARFLLKHPDFQTAEIQKMLRRHVEHRERGITINPRTTPVPKRSRPKQVSCNGPRPCSLTKGEPFEVPLLGFRHGDLDQLIHDGLIVLTTRILNSRLPPIPNALP